MTAAGSTDSCHVFHVAQAPWAREDFAKVNIGDYSFGSSSMAR